MQRHIGENGNHVTDTGGGDGLGPSPLLFVIDCLLRE